MNMTLTRSMTCYGTLAPQTTSSRSPRGRLGQNPRATLTTTPFPPSEKGLVISKTSKRILPLLSELVEVQALTSAFETLAGRGAMVGFASAASVELLLPTSGLFGAWDHAKPFAVLGLSLVIIAALLAAASHRTKTARKLGVRLLEPILASLTSRAGAVSGVKVDSALDAALDLVFSNSFLQSMVFPSVEIISTDEDSNNNNNVLKE